MNSSFEVCNNLPSTQSPGCSATHDATSDSNDYQAHYNNLDSSHQLQTWSQATAESQQRQLILPQHLNFAPTIHNNNTASQLSKALGKPQPPLSPSPIWSPSPLTTNTKSNHCIPPQHTNTPDNTTPSPQFNCADNTDDTQCKDDKETAHNSDKCKYKSFHLPSSDTQKSFVCAVCSSQFPTSLKLKIHEVKCRLGTTSLKSSISQVKRSCVICRIKLFSNRRLFELHHIKNHLDKEARVNLVRLSATDIKTFTLDSHEKSLSSSSGGSSREENPLRITLKLNKKHGSRKKKTTASIISSEGMNPDPSNENTGDTELLASNTEPPAREQQTSNQSLDLSENSESNGDENSQELTTAAAGSDDQQSNTFDKDGNAFDSASTGAEQTPSSSYEPQFESFTRDWFNDSLYDSGPRIAAAMAGASQQDANSAPDNEFVPPDVSSTDKDTEPLEENEGENNGLFSQEVLGGGVEGDTSAPPSNEAGGGSFEELCLNDSFGQSEPSVTESNDANESQFHQNQATEDVLSQLAYINNSGSQVDHPRNSPQSEDAQFNSHGSNSSTPTSSAGHPTPPPSDTSFRALATSPLASPSSPMTAGHTPPLPTGSPGQQQQLNAGSPQLSTSQEGMGAPRLTIANNLMAPPTTTSSGIPSMLNSYGPQWGTQPGQTSPSNAYPNSYINSSVRNNSLPLAYRPSPPPRIRGRPPLLGGVGVGRPPMMRGPGRPSGTTTLPPPLLAAPANSRGGMMPSLQRFSNANNSGQAQKRSHSGQQNSQSPNKSLKREDINVPSRQKDTECQIIAVANRNEGMPVIANVQGGGTSSERGARTSSPATTTESTIHLSDSITLSVRQNAGKEAPPARGERGGDAGVVANLLASRGITVTPAAGEKEGAAVNGSREERRLPSASDLNLSSAISVHPPTSRDRDGFAVPQPPSARSSSSSSSSNVTNNQVERPPRPPTVDLTQELPSNPVGRVNCSQCDRTFPTAALLADHMKVHQQQTQSRMPYKCHLCTAGFSSQKGQQNHYQQFHQLHLSAGDLAIPVVDFRNPVNIQHMTRMGIRSFLPLSNLQNRGAAGVVGIPILTLENLQNGQRTLQQWGVTDILSLGPARTINAPR